MSTLDPIALSLLRQIQETEDDVAAIQSLPLDVRMGIAFMDGFARIGIRDQLVCDLADHLVLIPCEGIDTREYEVSRWPRRTKCAYAIISKVRKLLTGGQS